MLLNWAQKFHMQMNDLTSCIVPHGTKPIEKIFRQEFFPAFAWVRMHALHVFAPTLLPKKYFYVLAPGGCVNTATIFMKSAGRGANTYFENNSSKVCSCIHVLQIQAPRALTQKIGPKVTKRFLHVLVLCRGGVNHEQLVTAD